MKRLLMLSVVLLGLSMSTQAQEGQEAKGEQAVVGQLATVNINQADAKQLTALPGIGAVKAKAIVDYRQQHGPFKNVEDLIKVDGIGAQTVKGLKSKVSVN